MLPLALAMVLEIAVSAKVGRISLYKAGERSEGQVAGSKQPLVPKSAFESQYYGEIGIGNPPQPFTVLLDLSGTTLWVPSLKCDVSPGPSWIHKRYASSKSSTYKPNGNEFSAQFGDQTIEGFLSDDVLTLGGVKIWGQSFAEVTKEPGLGFLLAPYDGVLGLGLGRADSSSDGALRSPMRNAVEQDGVEQLVFSLYLSRDATKEEGAGELIIGATDPDLFTGPLTWTALTSKQHWQFEMGAVSVSGEEEDPLCSEGCQAVVDLSRSVIIGPVDAVQSLLDQMKIQGPQVEPSFVDPESEKCQARARHLAPRILSALQHSGAPKDGCVKASMCGPLDALKPTGGRKLLGGDGLLGDRLHSIKLSSSRQRLSSLTSGFGAEEECDVCMRMSEYLREKVTNRKIHESDVKSQLLEYCDAMDKIRIGQFDNGPSPAEVGCAKVDRLPEVSLTIGGQKFPLTPKEYVLRVDGRCFIGFVGADLHASYEWVLGDLFLRAFYTNFDVKNARLGFARARP